MPLTLDQLFEGQLPRWMKTGFIFPSVIMEDLHRLLYLEHLWEGQEVKLKEKMTFFQVYQNAKD